MSTIVMQREWPVRISSHKTCYRKVFPLSELDDIVLSLLALHSDSLEFDHLGSILGFAMHSNAHELYSDEAEQQVFTSLLSSIQKFHLISIIKNSDDKKLITTTSLGVTARVSRIKHLFFEGSISVPENYLLEDATSVDNIFDFTKHDIYSKISDAKEIKPYETVQEENTFLAKARLNFYNGEDGNKEIVIDWVSPQVLFFEKLIADLSLTLNEIDDGLVITTALNNVPSIVLDRLILQEENKSLYDEWLLCLRYKLYLQQAKEIEVQGLVQFLPAVKWHPVFSDSRFVWSDDLFKLLIDKNITEISTWRDIVAFCPESILTSQIKSYVEYWDWTALSGKLAVDFIIKTIDQYPWDIDIILERTTQQELEFLLISLKDPYSIQYWQDITEKVSYTFIKDNITSLPFDLYTITRFGESYSKELIIENTDLPWDWSGISSTWALRTIVSVLDFLHSHLDITIVFSRVFESQENYDIAFSNSPFIQFLIEKSKDVRFGKEQNILLNTDTISFLSKNNMLFWGNENIAGVEANKNISWSREMFDLHCNKVKNRNGYDRVSSSIESLEIVRANPSFSWNYTILSSRKDLSWEFEFIKVNQERLLLNLLIDAIPADLIADNLDYFFQWATTKDMLVVLCRHISNEFSFTQILKNKDVFKEYNAEADWKLILRDVRTEDLNELIITNESELNSLPSEEVLIELFSERCGIEFILYNPDLPWNWKIVTEKRLPFDSLTSEDFQIEYASYLHWEYIIERHISAEDLSPDEKLSSLAVLIAQSTPEVQKQSWSAITAKITPHNLWNYLKQTFDLEIFAWDWNYISSIKQIPIDHSFLSTFAEKINWKIFSKNAALASFFQYNTAVYNNNNQWVERTLEYLYRYKEHWDFKSLSTINNLTKNEEIAWEFVSEWDWKVISAESYLLLSRANRDDRREYDVRLLTKFAKFIDWKILSARFDVTIPISLLKRFVNYRWDWDKLSSHPGLGLTKDFLSEFRLKPWNYTALSSHPHFEVDKELLLFLGQKPWNYKILSNAQWIDNDLILQLNDKEWDWQILSNRSSLIFDLTLLKIFISKSDVDWDKVLVNQSLHITLETVSLLYKANILDPQRWKKLSGHDNLDLKQHPLLLDQYREKWNWGSLIANESLDIDDVKILSDNQDFIDWDLICSSPRFNPSHKILEQFSPRLNWKTISRKMTIDNNVIRLYKDFLDWQYLSQNTSIKLTTEMIGEFRMYWDYYSLQNNISLDKDSRSLVSRLIDETPELNLYLKLKEKKSKWSGYIYHFTHLTNAIDIVKNQKILSRDKATRFADAAGSVVGRRDTAHQFARFYFRPQTPTQYYNECLGADLELPNFQGALKLGLPKCPIPVFFRFNLQEVLLKHGSKCFTSNGNMQTNWALVKPVSQMLGRFNFEDIYSTITNTSTRDYKTYIAFSQQEFLIKDQFDFSDIRNYDIIVRNQNDKDELTRSIGKGNRIVNKIIVATDTDDIYHNKNKDVVCIFENQVLTVATQYKGTGAKSGRFIVEFPPYTQYELIQGNVINVSDSMISCYPSLEIRFLNQATFTVYFQDDYKNIKWKLYNWN